MNNEVITPLEKNTVQQSTATGTGKEAACCGGAPTQNADACCQLDEQKKAEGEVGCGCGTAQATPATATGCC